jgi:Ca-activated chloride channel family protein
VYEQIVSVHCAAKGSARTVCVLFIMTGSMHVAFSQSIRSLVNNGNELYEKKQFSDAEAEYKKSLEKEKDLMQGTFNLGMPY